MAAALVLLHDPRFRRVWLLAVGFAVLTPGDAMLYLALERRVDLSAGYFPLLYFGTSVVFLLAAVPCGRLADRIGPLRVFVGGEALLVGAFASVGSRATGLGMILAMLILLGGYYAATDGVLMALISPLIPDDLRTSGMGVVIGAMAIGHLIASVAFGAAWAAYGPATAIHLFMIGLVGMVVVGALTLRRTDLVAGSVNRRSTWGFALLCLVCVVGAVGYSVIADRRADRVTSRGVANLATPAQLDGGQQWPSRACSDRRR